MAQFQWTVLGVSGKTYEVGLYHGDRSGHLMVHCDGNVIITDFYIKESKKYSFFLDDELFDLEIEKKALRFGYKLTSNKSADTPLNRIIKKRDKTNLIKTLLLFGALVLGVLVFVLGVPKWQEYQAEKNHDLLLIKKGEFATARFTIDSSDLSIQYFFVANGRSMSKKMSPISLQNTHSGSLVFPLQTGDEFTVKYVSNSPSVHKIIWNQPTFSQIEKYKQRTTTLHKRNNPDYSAEKAACEVDLAFQIDSLRGIAHFFFQKENEHDNPQFNQNSYLRFVRNEPFRKSAREHCWH